MLRDKAAMHDPQKQAEMTKELRTARNYLIGVGILMFLMDMLFLHVIHKDEYAANPQLRTVVFTASCVVLVIFLVLAFFTSGVSPQPLSVRIYSAIRFGIQPSINAVGTLMLLGSILLIAVALVLPRLLGRRGSGLDLFKS